MFDQALENLPHGPEFRFLDEITDLDPGKSGRAQYAVRGNEAFLDGHFPGHPIMPGVILIEMLAQLAGVVAQSDRQSAPMRNLRLTAVRAAKILGTAEPGEVLEASATIAGRLGNLVQAQGEITSGGRVLLTAQVTLSGDAG